MTTRRVAVILIVLMVLSVAEGVMAPPASARWAVHDASYATEFLPAPGGTEEQTCPDRLRARAGFSTFSETPDSIVVPQEAFDPYEYDIYAAKGGRNFDLVQAVTDPSGNIIIGWKFPDGTRVPKLASFTTAPLAKLTPPLLIFDDTYVLTAVTIDRPLPTGAVGPGDKIALVRSTDPVFDDVLDVIDCESTKPACTLTKKTSTGIEVTVRDTGSGLKSIQVTKAVNATVTMPTFTAGTKIPLVVKATKTNPAQASQVALRVRDVQGNITDCDPVLTTLVNEKKPQVFTDVPAAEHLVSITNGDPGLRRVMVTVNGDIYWRHLRPGQKVTIDVSGSITPGANTFKLRGWGRGSADIMIWDGQGTI